MVWFLTLHIMALVFWCGAQLFLPVLIRGLHVGDALGRVALADESMGMPRFVFTRIATPAALVAIMSGTIVFLLNQTVELWLLLKLALVASLVVAHALSGWLLLLAPSLSTGQLGWRCHLLMLMSAVLMAAILWTVLAKPFRELLL